MLSRWLAGLPPPVETGPLPSWRELDDWARRHTFGLIDKFPIPEDAGGYFVAATALATKVTWERPFDLAPASALGPSSPWAGRLSQVLRTPDGPGHEQFIAASRAAGDVAVHTARAPGGLLVTSVAAAADVPPADVLAAAYEIAVALGSGGSVARRSLFDLPLGEGGAWVISEQAEWVKGATDEQEKCTAVLPAWSARSEHDLRGPQFGFAAALAALEAYGPWRATQAAMARYSREGFEAAAVTAVAVAVAMILPRRVLVRTAELRFGHPYAVVAVAAADDHSGELGASPWHGLPVFSAWVGQPEDAGPE